jgi:hypothetical protein
LCHSQINYYSTILSFVPWCATIKNSNGTATIQQYQH